MIEHSSLFRVFSFFFCCSQKLEEADDDTHLQSNWSDRQALKRQFQGLTNIKWGPR